MDYDSDPGRFAANTRSTALFLNRSDVHPEVAEKLAAEGCTRVLDVGGGPGALAKLLLNRGVPTVVLDLAGHVAGAPGPAVQADARRMPFQDGSFDGAAALWMLYHLADPAEALTEVHRVLQPGGWFVAATPSRFNDPELAEVLPAWGLRSSFDAEDAPALVGGVFDIVDVVSWDAKLVTLPDRRAVRLFLRGRGLSELAAEECARELPVPMKLTKRGSLIWARKGPLWTN